MTRVSRISVRTRVVLLAVVPLISIGILMGWYTLHTRLTDARASLEERCRIIAENLAMAGEFGLLTRNTDLLQGVCDRLARRADVVSAAILDADSNLLAIRGTGELHPESMAGDHFSAPIEGSEVALSDFGGEFGEGEGEGGPFGWAVVQASRTESMERQRQIMTTSILILGGGLLISVLTAISIGRGISRPLMDLSSAMARYRQDDLSARVEVRGGAELGDLQRDFNRMAEALEQSQSTLQSRIAAATRELEQTVAVLSANNEQLVVAREEALAAAREKYEFLARMSHEIRTPLNAVIGFSRLLSEDTGGWDTREYLQTIDGAANQLLCVIDGILNFTKLESGAVELEQIPFDLGSCIEDVVAMLSPAAHDKGLELALMLHRDIPHRLVGDPSRIRQVAVNLLNNAIKFTNQGHVFVEAGVVGDDSGSQAVRVTVCDTGVGIDAAVQTRLFEPFIQADSAVTRRFGGTGLGASHLETADRSDGW